MIGVTFAGGVVLAADTRQVRVAGGLAQDGFSKLRAVPWGFVAGGGRTDVLTRVRDSFRRRPNPSLAELEAVFVLAAQAAEVSELSGGGSRTELLYSYEPRGLALRSGTRARPSPSGETSRESPVRLYRAHYPIADHERTMMPAQIAVLPPRDIDHDSVVRWVADTRARLWDGGPLPSQAEAVAAVLDGIRVLAPGSLEVSPDADIGIHEEGRRFRMARIWW